MEGDDEDEDDDEDDINDVKGYVEVSEKSQQCLIFIQFGFLIVIYRVTLAPSIFILCDFFSSEWGVVASVIIFGSWSKLPGSNSCVIPKLLELIDP